MNFIVCLFAFFLCNQAIAGDFRDFNLPVMNGDPGQTYSSAHNKPMLVEFYYNGCSACQANAENVKRMANEFNTDKTHVVEFGYDCSQREYDAWIRRHEPTAFVLNGCDAPIFDELGIGVYPTTIIFDKDHKVVKRVRGTWNQRTYNELREIMTRLAQ